MTNYDYILKLAEEFNNSTKLFAACLLIINDEGKILAVARRGSKNAWGLPGGKIEENENPKSAATRECFEETGINVLTSDLILLHQNVDDHNNRVVTYFAKKWSGEARQGDAGSVKWITPKELLSGPFKDYNYDVLKKFLG